ncbi:hypothetical protein D9M68_115670 [compost metagenome]
MPHTAGRYFEDFAVGDTYLHDTRKVISEADIGSVPAIPEQLESRCEEGLRGQPQAIHGSFAVPWACEVGIGVLTSETSLGELRISDVRILRALCYADTLSVESEVLELQGADGRNDAGAIEFEVRVYNQQRQLVAKFRCTALVKKTATGN